jgi:Family of unknown function (DUF5343)
MASLLRNLLQSILRAWVLQAAAIGQSSLYLRISVFFRRMAPLYRGIIPIAIDRDRSRSKAVMAEALREGYQDAFLIREVPTTADRSAVEGLFKSKHNSTDKVAQLQAMTFFALLKLADLKAAPTTSTIAPETSRKEAPKHEGKSVPIGSPSKGDSSLLTTELHYTIQVHLPATKDIEVFNAIFRSLRDNLLS